MKVAYALIAVLIAAVGYLWADGQQAASQIKALAVTVNELERQAAAQRRVDEWWEDYQRRQQQLNDDLALSRNLGAIFEEDERRRAIQSQQDALDSMAESARQLAESRQQREARIQAYYQCRKQGGTKQQCYQ